MRALFGVPKGKVFFSFDFSSLEARIEAAYLHKYAGGPEMGKSLLAEKPDDIHSITALKNGIDRNSAKSLNYMTLYGAAPPKIAKSLGISLANAKDLFTGYWLSVPPLKELKDNLTKYWENTGKKNILGLDGRLVPTRSPHGLLNSLLQSGGVIAAKYVTVFIAEELEKLGHNLDPFVGDPDFCSMIEYHDEADYQALSKFFKFKTFETEEEAISFKKTWSGEQLSAIGHGKKYYICLPNDISIAVSTAIKKMEKLLKLSVPLGFEYMVGNNWAECH